MVYHMSYLSMIWFRYLSLKFYEPNFLITILNLLLMNVLRLLGALTDGLCL
ncbi:hypothetical protein RchiOBHm_Chr4g0417681 [Rosa chinensis]|uniref:Uncharacterized protein n=1 Tax=Rosa chinensis TaxID=74649 RepID=A0A2P6QX94_ROSCH|nr:hypothetical protein RchiOBHm_Chr4g0417681 [Rosa chinensis]